MEVSEVTVNVEAAVPPKLTPVAPVNPVPVMVTLVPPPVGPEVAATSVTTGVPAAAAGPEVARTKPAGSVSARARPAMAAAALLDRFLLRGDPALLFCA